MRRMLKKKNKRGWVKMLEVFISIMLLMGAVTLVLNKNVFTGKITQETNNQIDYILRAIQLDSSLRGEILDASLPVEWEDFVSSGFGPVTDIESFSASADYATYQGSNVGWVYTTADTSACIDDANDDCICYDEDTIDAADNLSKQSSIDMSGCSSGTGNVTFTKLWEQGTLEPTDCITAFFSDDGGLTWGGSTEIACDDPGFLADPLTIAIPNAYLVSGFRMRLQGFQGTGGGAERMCADGIIIACAGSSGSNLGNTRTEILSKTPPNLICQAKVCTLNDVCLNSNVIPNKNIYSRVGYISADLDTYSPRQLKIFCWKK